MPNRLTQPRPKVGEKGFQFPRETIEQQKLISWVDVFHMDKSPYLFAVPNGGSRHPVEAARLKAEGVRPGVPDLFFYQARGGYFGMFIEMKRRKGAKSVVTGGQEGFMKRARVQGYLCVVAWGCEEAKEALLGYWSLPATGKAPADDLKGLGVLLDI